MKLGGSLAGSGWLASSTSESPRKYAMLKIPLKHHSISDRIIGLPLFNCDKGRETNRDGCYRFAGRGNQPQQTIFYFSLHRFTTGGSNWLVYTPVFMRWPRLPRHHPPFCNP